MKTFLWLASSILFLFLGTYANADWKSETFKLNSSAIKENKLGISQQREIRVWLPPSYKNSQKRFPVIYYIHNFGWSNKQLHEQDNIGEVFQRALSRGQTEEFIFVAGDFTATPWAGTFFGNNNVVGHWIDHIAEELVPAIDKRYRTLAKPESRGVSGDFMGGYGAIRVAMDHPGVFSSVYALHPVGTDRGERLMRSVSDWRAFNGVKTHDDLIAIEGMSNPFILMAQSHAPNPSRPPIYADLMLELEGDTLKVNAQTTTRLHNNFLLRNRIPDHVTELKALRGLMFDWSRYDDNADHVYANQKFTRVLDEYGIPHYAEEYRSEPWWSELWTPYGRVEDRMLPFFNRFLDFSQ